MQKLFGQPYDDSDIYWVVNGYFDRMYGDGAFIKSIGCIVRKNGFSTDGAYCNFPDMESPFEEDHFDGIEFAYGYPPTDDETVVISEEACATFVRMVCDKYLQRHPEDAEKVKELLDSLSF